MDLNKTPIDQAEEILEQRGKDRKKTITKDIPSFLSVTDIAPKLNMTKKEVQDEISRGNLIYYFSGSKYYIPDNVADLNDYATIHSEMKKKDATTVAVGVAKGGVCKTSCVANLSPSLAFFGKKVLMVDADTSQCDLSTVYGANIPTNNKNIDTHNLVSLIKDAEKDELTEEKIRASIVSIDVSERFNGGVLDILPSSLSLKEETKTIDPSRNKNSLDKILKPLKDEYDYIIIDTPPSINSPMIDLTLFTSDWFLLSLIAEPTTYLGMRDIIKPIKQSNDICGKNCRVLGGVFNRYKNEMNLTIASTYETVDRLVEQSGRKQLMIDSVSFAPTIAETQLNTGAMIFKEPNSKVSREYIRIASKILLYTLSANTGE